ncbi:MAG: acyl-CoA dehydrogenase [Pseudomonadales bacterium]|jgi:acyl-CoA dehydrogenase|uniref:acyl-CoA dehydrogenase family protein n=1 Tax=unclassified Ketobacter TaxID=2639109 RepID=UPI000C5F21B1|nr:MULTISPECIES: acyl-CoA dehydrogenase family protein [unclassified Ketobacter]MAQ23802.1 acyl-CoA dehydrogenase [Pseudomonadales bacterium]MEC8810322.1 acyl-CoA dehydrogenase family protein [Pseudomonadota bacterium]HAG94519.1 acyl-CoA dehydrogenase [Gammaproteobacteria bacterium]MBI26213.1 acyl-CoA dehydrogenase [Pseudomonadales bacterium]MCK5792031.1 acyl-CoA dehydrogenase family protein [Ketobacter sp.]|tara:strand:+ start:59533 stop:60735 length:1203 start_codon:yes stop_codon:yes gene_type:complete
MYLELPKKLKVLGDMATNLSVEMLRPISRKYDLAEHDYPKELDLVASMLDGMNDGEGGAGVGADQSKQKSEDNNGVRNGANMAACVGIQGFCWGDVGLLLTLPRQGLGNAAIGAVANEEQAKRFQGKWAAMAITEPGTGSDSANISTTAKLDGDHYVLNGEKIYVTAGSRADIIVVWATIDKSAGRAAIKSFAVERGTPGMEVTRLEHKLGIKASDTAAISFSDCRVHKSNLLGNPEIDTKKGFGGVMQTFDNTRPLVAAMAVGVAKAALDRTKELMKDCTELNYSAPINSVSAAEAEIYRMEADWEAARLLTLQAAWMADNGKPNSMEASMAKAKAGRACNAITLKCVELCSGLGYSEDELLEKWSRDSKILDIFEGTQQIQQLIVARRLLNLSSAELK